MHKQSRKQRGDQLQKAIVLMAISVIGPRPPHLPDQISLFSTSKCLLFHPTSGTSQMCHHRNARFIDHRKKKSPKSSPMYLTSPGRQPHLMFPAAHTQGSFYGVFPSQPRTSPADHPSQPEKTNEQHITPPCRTNLQPSRSSEGGGGHATSQNQPAVRCGALALCPPGSRAIAFRSRCRLPVHRQSSSKGEGKSGCLAWKIIKQRNQNDRRKLPLLLAGLCHLRTARRPGRLKARKPISENHTSFHTTSTARQKEKKRRPASLVFRFGSVIPFSPTTSN